MKKYYCSQCSIGHGNWLEPLGFESTRSLKEADVIIFGGGADIDPVSYGEETNKRTYSSPGREKMERSDFFEALELKKKMVGICRGHQFLTVMAGGKLIQHVNNHSGDHTITTFDERTVRANSLHHQMINPYGMNNKDYKILAWTSSNISDSYLGGKEKSITLPWDFKEIESIYLPKIDALGYQYHPEMIYGSQRYTNDIINWTQTTFNKFFNNLL